ncbi:MAG: M4 family metallopeptidase [Ferruginibacter sp.]
MKKLFFTTLILLIGTWSFSQVFEFSERINDAGGNAAFVKLQNQPPADRQLQVLLIRELLPAKLQQQIEIRPVRNYEDKAGFTHFFYSFYFKGIEIINADYVLHCKAGRIESANGRLPIANYSGLETGIPIDFKKITPIVLKKTLLRQALLKLAAEDLTATDQGLFLLYRDGTVKLVVKAEVKAGRQPVSDIFLLDAVTGEILSEGSTICSYGEPVGTENSPPPYVSGTAATLYSGAQSIITDLTGGQYRLYEMRNTITPMHTRNANFYDTYSDIETHATEFFDNDNNWQAAEHAGNRQALDVHWAMGNTIDYWRNVHARNSFDDWGQAVKSYVHLQGFIAYYDVTYHTFNFGDGNSQFLPLAELDIVSHEFGHGVTQYTCNLYTGTSFEASSLNEGFSDIWGACTEHWAAPAKNPWISGEEITQVAPFFYRSLSDPFSSLKPQPNTYHGTNWAFPGPGTGYDEHKNAGVLCHWFYLLVNGGTGWNNGQSSHAPAGSGYQWNVTGIGWRNAEKIAYRTEQLLSASSDYAATRIMSIQAARELFGAGSCEEVSVTRAWYAVGVGGNWVAGNPVAAPLINGPDIICSSSPGTYYINYNYFGIPSCGTETISWSANPSNIVSFSCSTCPQTTITATGTGFTTITATVTSGSQVQTKTKYIKVGPYSDFQVQISGYTMVPLNYTSSYSVNMTNYPGISNLTWTWPSPPYYYPPYAWSQVYSGGTNYKILRSGSAASTGDIRVYFSACGVNSYGSKWTAWGYGGPSYRLTPNPASDVVRIDELDAAEKMPAVTGIQTVEIVDRLGTVVLKKLFAKGVSNGISIPVSLLKSDLYTVRIFNGKEWRSYKLLIQH